MTKETAKQFLPLVQALAEGKTIQARQFGAEWVDTADPGFACSPNEYRVKPEPRRWWLVWDTCGAAHVCDSQPNKPYIEVVEVLK